MKKLLGINRAAILAGLLCSVLFSGVAFASEVAVVKVRFELRGDSWNVNTTLRHADTGWSHYADAWRIVDKKGNVIGKRILYHPHVDEQPFTRSLGNVQIPKGVTVVFVEAHDKESGWSKQRVRVDLSKSKGERFEVRR